MGVLYLAALIVGLGISLIQVVMSGHGDSGDVHADVDVDGGADFDADADGQAHGHFDGAVGFAAIFLSLRFWTFGALGFGLVGTLLTYLSLAAATPTLVLACALGLVSGAGASWAFRALASASTDSGGEVRDLLGQTGRVLVRIDAGARGKIRVSVRGQTRDLLAMTDEGAFAAGEPVMIESVDGDIVRVCRMPDELRLPPAR